MAFSKESILSLRDKLEEDLFRMQADLVKAAQIAVENKTSSS